MKTVGKIFANIAHYAGVAALWASQHPEVVSIIEGVAKLPPPAARIVNAGISAGAAIEQAKQQQQ